MRDGKKSIGGLLLDDIEHGGHLVELFGADIGASSESKVDLYKLATIPTTELAFQQPLKCVKRTRECLPFIISLVKGFPFWSTSSNVPPTLGRPTPLAASAILLRCMRSFSYSKYHTNKPQVPTNRIPAFHEKGYAHLSATYSFFAHRILADPANSYPIAISALGLLDRLILGPALGNRLSRRNGCSEGRPELFRLEGAASEAALTLPC